MGLPQLGPRIARTLAGMVVIAAAGLVLGGCGDHSAPVDAGSVSPDSVSAGMATLQVLAGRVELDRGGAKSTVQGSAALFDGDLVITGAKARAAVLYPDGRKLEVAEGSRFRLGTAQRGMTLTLEEGSIVSDTRGLQRTGQPRMSLSILTPEGQTRIVEGAEVELSLSGGKTHIGVAFGEISVEGSDGKQVPLVAGDTVDLALGAITRHAKQPAVVESEPLEFTLSPERGTVLLRKPGASDFSPARKGPGTVLAGASFRLRKGVRASLTATGLRVHLGEAAAGTLGPASKAAEASRYQLSLEGGEAEVAFVGPGARELTLGGAGKQLALQADGAATAEILQTPAGPVVEVHAGQLTLRDGARSQVVTAGQSASLAEGALRTAPLPRPAWILPPGRKVRVFTDGVREVALGLPASAAKGAQVEVASDPEFSDLRLGGRVSADYVIASAPLHGDLFWRVLGEDGRPAEASSARFELDRGKRAREESPRAEVEETGLKASVYFQSAAPAITLAFAPRPGAAQYRVRVYRADDLKTPELEQLVREPRCDLKAGSLGEGNYLWYAAPLAASGAELAGGRMNKLEIAYDNSRRNLAIAAPRSAEKIRSAVLETHGVAPLGTTLFVNEKSAPLDEKGRFALQVPSAAQLVYRLHSGPGSDAFWVRHLRTAP